MTPLAALLWGYLAVGVLFGLIVSVAFSAGERLERDPRSPEGERERLRRRRVKMESAGVTPGLVSLTVAVAWPAFVVYMLRQVGRH